MSNGLGISNTQANLPDYLTGFREVHAIQPDPLRDLLTNPRPPNSTGDPTNPQITGIVVIDDFRPDSGGQSHGAGTREVAENSSTSANNNARSLQTNLELDPLDRLSVVSRLNNVADNPGNTKVVNLSLGLSPAGIYENLKIQHPNWSEKRLVDEAMKQYNSLVAQYGGDIDKALDQLGKKGITVVVSAGNEGDIKPGVPTPPGFYDNIVAGTHEHSNVIVVGSTDSNTSRGRASDFSNPGRSVDVAADGEDKLVGGQVVDGTSFSAPEIAGLAADILAVNPSLTPAEVKEIIKQSAYKETDGARTGAGVVNRKMALQLAQPIGSQTSVATDTPYFTAGENNSGQSSQSEVLLSARLPDLVSLYEAYKKQSMA